MSQPAPPSSDLTGTPEKPPAGAALPERRTRVNKTVFFGSAAGVLTIALWAIFAKDNAEAVIGSLVGWVSTHMGWYYFLIVTAVLVFVVVIAMSRVGKTKLGPDHSKPQFGMFTWAAMLFAAGIGIDLMFFSVSEPVSQYLAPPTGEGGTAEAARQALVWTLFHYGVTGWALYALMGLALGYFAYRHNLPLSIRSALYPIFGKKIDGPDRPRRGHRGRAGHHLRHRHLARYRRGPAQLRADLYVRHPGKPGCPDRADRPLRRDGHGVRGLRRGKGHPAACPSSTWCSPSG